MNIGDSVVPLTKVGLWLADVPVNGEYNQPRNDVCVFKGIGTIIDVHKCIIDYDDWDRIRKSLYEGEDYVPYEMSKVDFFDYLIQCDDGIGWGAGIKLLNT